MRKKAEKDTGEKKAYMPNVTAETKEMLKRAQFVKDHGGRYIMVDIMTVGWSGVQTLRNQDLGMIMHAHRAMHAAFTRNPRHGISMVVEAEIAKLIGVDQLHVGTVVGKMAEKKDEFLRIVKATRPVFPVCSGGLHPGLVRPLVKLAGKDIIIQAGGGVHGYPGGTAKGAAAMRKAAEKL